MIVLPVLCLVVAAGSLTHGLPPPEKPANILMLLPFSSKSHRNVFMPLATALTQRGHKITMLSNDPPQDKNPAITYLQHTLPYWRHEEDNIFESLKDPTAMFDKFKITFPLIGRDFYQCEVVKKLWAKRDTFDVVIIDSMFNEVCYLFAHNKPLITLSPGNIDPASSAVMGNLLNPAYVSNFLENYPVPMSFVNRVKNIFFSIVGTMTFKGTTRGLVQTEISKQFPNMPNLIEFERRQDFNFYNGHHTLGMVLPLLPNQIEVGGMHLRPAKPLPKELNDFVAGSTPVIYFSLGSIAKSKDIDPKHIEILLSAFGKLPYKVIWKYEVAFENLPKNILIQKWMPQQDILAHPNVKVFISHCGMLGTQEALYAGTPMLGLPIFGDQPKNAETMLHRGFGRYITWEALSEKLLVDEITELVTNPKYSQVAASISHKFKDQMTTPTDRAVYWTEYVIRHKGAQHLRSPEADLSWIELLGLDILAMIHLVIFIVYKLLSKLFGLCFGKKKSPKSKNKKE